MPDPTSIEMLFEQYRGLLFSIAYRMLGSAMDAEDIVQESFVRWLQAGEAEVQAPKAYLTSIVVRLCIDQLRMARVRRERYLGPWLPEPIATNQRLDLLETAVQAESLAFAFLVMLEQLHPLERAVFLLREVFEYNYVEIAPIVGKSEANCRQILHRAHLRLGEGRPRFKASYEQQERIARQFVRASQAGDMQGLLALLTDDILLTTDGGGKVRTGLKPIYGPDKVIRGLVGGLRTLPQSAEVAILELNGQPGLVLYAEGRIYAATLLGLEGERIRRIDMVLNPDKLKFVES
jgi:RNA polymerase sigma-70 factor (ECF subfamily)